VGFRSRADAAAARWATNLAARLRPEDVERLSRRMLEAIDDVSANRWGAAKRRAEALPGTIRPEKIDALSRSFARELGAAGAAAGAAAVAPAVGTGATLVTAIAELGWFTARAGDLILTIAAVHGRTDPTVEERRAWVLAVLIYGSSAKDGFARALNEAAVGVAPVVNRRLSLTTLQTANRLMSRSLARRYGSRRALIAVGRALPIGIGAFIGGSANYVAIRTLARNADQFFARLPYSAIDVESTDLTGRQLGREGGPHLR
jgi:hypothetical protein